MLQWALKYLKQGFSVIPLKPNGKEPLIKWQEFQMRKATEEELKKWWSAAPNANIGIVTGQISNLAIIDLDGPSGAASASELGLTSTVTSLTGNGKHLWYQNNESVRNAVKKYPGVDVRAEGGYIVAPPSIHESGKRYRWLKPLGAYSVVCLPQFPECSLKANVPIVSTITPVKESGWIAKALEDMKDGNIDNTLTSILGRLRRDGYSADDAKVFLEPHVKRVGAEDGHLEAKIENIWSRYEPTTRNTDVYRDRETSSELVIHSPDNADSWKQYEDRQRVDTEKGSGINTGYAKLDSYCQGGLKSSRLFTLAARTGVGKTNWVIGAVKSLCEAGRSVLLFSTEMSYGEIWERYLAILPNREEFKRHRFFICDSFAPDIEKIEEALSQIKPDVFIFDHINHVSEEQKALGTFMQGLNWLQRKYECAGIVTAQLNRQADWVDLKTGEKVTPRMSMIKGSGTIEQASSRVLLLSESRVTPECVEIVGNLDKNDRGEKGLIHFGLFKNPWRMEELP